MRVKFTDIIEGHTKNLNILLIMGEICYFFTEFLILNKSEYTIKCLL